jgi:hypothetical protein
MGACAEFGLCGPPRTRNFTSPLILSHLKTDWAWLRDQVLTAIRRGDERAAIHESNLIPPDLLARQPDAHQPYYTTSCASM